MDGNGKTKSIAVPFTTDFSSSNIYNTSGVVFTSGLFQHTIDNSTGGGAVPSCNLFFMV